MKPGSQIGLVIRISDLEMLMIFMFQLTDWRLLKDLPTSHSPNWNDEPISKLSPNKKLFCSAMKAALLARIIV